MKQHAALCSPVFIFLKNLQLFHCFHHIVLNFSCFPLVTFFSPFHSFLLGPVLSLRFLLVQYPCLLPCLFLPPLLPQPSDFPWSFLFRLIVLSNFANLEELSSGNASKVGGVSLAIGEIRELHIPLYSGEPLSSPPTPINRPIHFFLHL